MAKQRDKIRGIRSSGVIPAKFAKLYSSHFIYRSGWLSHRLELDTCNSQRGGA